MIQATFSVYLQCLTAWLSLCLLLSGCGAKVDSRPRLRATVTRVVDGDTLLVLIDGQPEEVHLDRLESPELTQPYGVEAATWLAGKCLGREIVIVERQRDNVGHIYGVVLLDDENLNLELAKAGFAHVHEASYADPETVAAVNEAMLSLRGLWDALAPPLRPADWRRIASRIEPGPERPLDGVWKVTSAQWMGEFNPGSEEAYYIFAGDKVTICESPMTTERTFTLDASVDPAEITYTQKTRDGKLVEIRGIYRLVGDRLTLCNSRHSQERPRVFESSTTEVGCSLIELQRVTVPERFGYPPKADAP